MFMIDMQAVDRHTFSCLSSLPAVGAVVRSSNHLSNSSGPKPLPSFFVVTNPKGFDLGTAW